MKNKRYGKTSDKITKVAIGVLALAIVGVIGYVAVQFYNMPEYRTEREMNNLAKDYYENYFYDKFVNNVGDGSLFDAMGQHQENGMERVYLRQLLVFDGERHGDLREVFDSAHYTCNTNTSWVKYHPYEPYGKTDYSYEINLACKEQ